MLTLSCFINKKKVQTCCLRRECDRILKMLHGHLYSPFWGLEGWGAIDGYREAAKKPAHHHYVTNCFVKCFQKNWN